jgi:hypothetical protein
MDSTPDPVLAHLAAVQARRGATSKLAAWMRKNRNDYAALLAERGPAWEADAAVFVEAGLLPRPTHYDAEGPDGDAARRRAVNTAKQTWHRTLARADARRPAQRQRREQPTMSPTYPHAGSKTVPLSRAPSVGLTAAQLAGLRPGETMAEAAARRLAALDRELKERSR